MAARFFAPGKGFRNLLLAATVLLSFFVGSSIASSDAFFTFDVGAVEQLFVTKADASFGSLEDTYQATVALGALQKDVTGAEKTCKWLGTAVGKSGKDVFHALSISITLNCAWESLAKDRRPYLLKEVSAATDLTSLYYPLGALALAKKQGWLAEVDVPAEELATAVKKLQDLAVVSAGPLAVGLGAEIAANILLLGSDDDTLKAIKSWASTALGGALKQAKSSGEGGLYFEGVGDASAEAVTSTFAQGTVSLLSVEPTAFQVDDSKLTGFAIFLLGGGLPSSPSEAFSVLNGLHVLSENSYLVPVFYRLKSSAISVSSKEKLEVIVGTAVGKPVPNVRATLLSASAVGKSKALYSNVELVPSSDGLTYSLDFTSSSVGLGTYDVKLGVKVEAAEDGKKYAVTGPKMLRVRVIGKVTVAKATLSVLEDDDSPAFKTDLKFGKPAPASLSATHLQKLTMNFKLESGGSPFKAQQVFVKLIHTETGTSHVFACTWSDKSYGLSLNLLEMMEKLYYLSGPYSIDLIVGDVLMENSFVWALGTVNLDLESSPDSTKQPPKIVPIEEKFGPMKEIEHIMRLPDKRPPKLISYLFVILVLLPFLLFLFALSRLGVNFKAFPSAGGALLASSAFHGGIAATLVLYFLYWLKLDIFITFKTLFFLGVFTAVTGHYALSYLANSPSKVKAA